MEQKKQIGKKGSNLESGYVWAPYIPMTKNPVIVGGSFKPIVRKKKINKIFDLGLNIKVDYFSPNKSLSSRYSAVQIKNPYHTFVIDTI
jgi:hypothetical protein